MQYEYGSIMKVYRILPENVKLEYVEKKLKNEHFQTPFSKNISKELMH